MYSIYLDFFDKCLISCRSHLYLQPGDRLVRIIDQRILESEGILYLADLFVPDTGTLVKRVLTAALELCNDAEALNSLSFFDILFENHIFEFF